MKYLLKPLQWLYCIYALIVFIVLMLIVLPFVVGASFAGQIKGGNFMYKVFKFWARGWYFLVGIRHRNIYEAPHDNTKHHIFVANHISYLDIPPVILAIDQPVRVLGKYELSKIPVFGYIYRTAAVMVDRRNAEKRAQSVRRLKAIIRKNISIFIYPEGTFNETPKPLKEFYDGAFRIAIETQTPIKPLLLIDTLERLHYKSIFSLTPGKNRVVFLEDVPVDGLHMADVPDLKEKVYKIMEEGLKKYRNYPAEIPVSE